MRNELRAGASVRLDGEVTYVGSSSMEVCVRATSIGRDGSELLSGFTCFMTMVARDAITDRAARVHALKPETSSEKMAAKRGAANAAEKKVAAQEALEDVPPSVSEIAIVHDLFRARHNPAFSGANWMSLKATKFESTKLMHLEYRNIHRRVFGGLLMHKAHDLALCAVSVFFGEPMPTLTAVDNVAFRHPVELGSLLHMSAVVAYKHGSSAVVRVVAEVINPLTGERNITNTFFLTFTTRRPQSALPDLMPQSYDESLIYLEARRKFLATNKVAASAAQ
eukprot:TRINITY_DN759_c0_g1_i1.p1 TRINITY_DN759_c0_g1~~TRINITY_DN759_c0_g1_i1.p1  ORF type:complete len:280 (+),score=45.10 TRINITY_DN759_c0_g1_i1:410-1249(+)